MKQRADTLSNKKTAGRVYTPDYIVNNILDLCGYTGAEILGKHIIDNSCGDGAFLVQVVFRYCAAAREAGLSADQTAVALSHFIHGIEIDADECDKCRRNLSTAATVCGVTNTSWDIVCGDALDITVYNGKMDYVVGNPPYVRVHNLLGNYNSVKSYSFAQGGMTDLFIVFYEIGMNMLNGAGVLGYITPSSLYNSVAAATMRARLSCDRNIRAVVDLKHFQPFDATTYTTIMILSRKPNGFVDYRSAK